MKITKLLLLSLFVGSIVAHPQGLLDRYVYSKLSTPVRNAPLFKILKPTEEDVVNTVLPDKEIAKIHVARGHHVHVTAQNTTKMAAFVAALGLNIRDALQKNNNKIVQNSTTRNAVVAHVLKDALLDNVKDIVVDKLQDTIVDNLPESVTQRKVHPALKWVAGRLTGAALGVVYDRTAGELIKLGLKGTGFQK